MCTHKHTRVLSHVPTHTCGHMCAHKHACAHAHAHTNTHACTHRHMCSLTCVHTQRDARTCAHTETHMLTHVHTHKIHMCTHRQQTHTCTHTDTYTHGECFCPDRMSQKDKPRRTKIFLLFSRGAWLPSLSVSALLSLSLKHLLFVTSRKSLPGPGSEDGARARPQLRLHSLTAGSADPHPPSVRDHCGRTTDSRNISGTSGGAER